MDPAPTHPACQRGAGSDQWLHEIKFDGYRMHARFDRGAVRLLTRTGLDWTPAIAAAVASLPATQAYLEGELCGVRPDGITSFSMIQTASDSGNAAALVFFSVRSSLFDGEDVSARPLIECKARLAALLADAGSPLHYAIIRSGTAAHSMRKPAPWRSRGSSPNAPMRNMPPATAACGSRSNACTAWNLSSSAGPTPGRLRPFLGALLLAYYDPDGRLVYAGRACTGIKQAELQRAVAKVAAARRLRECRSRCHRRATAASARPWF
jgi:ATP-dependent DNA ligase